ncbi:MAG: hypothetical protein K8R37_06055 [Bacteroidales bacterium]|nr:hypothetical protein [Bacteroidales bacterium]
MNKNKLRIDLIILVLLILVSCSVKEKVVYQFNGIYLTSENGIEYAYYTDKDKIIKIDTIPIITTSDFEKIIKQYVTATNEPELCIQLNEIGTEKLRITTKENIGKRFAIILNDKLLSAPKAYVEIPTGEIIASRIDEKLIDKLIKYFKE